MSLARARLVLTLGLALADGCGYRSIASSASPSEGRLAVVLASSNLPDAVASDEVVAGVRDELARAGALAAGDGYPRCEVEVLRGDEGSEAISAAARADGKLAPQSRATRIGVLARAYVVRAKDGPRERDTGDVRALETVAVAPDARAASFTHGDALRAAGRRVGRRLAARILGLPAASED